MSAKRYLVTGGSGFLGAAITKRLLRAGHGVRILDNQSRGSLRRLDDVLGSVEVVTADIRDAEAVSGAVSGVDAVIHLAYVNGTEFFYSKPGLVLDVGIRGMLNVLDACKRHDVLELILASTSEVYQTPPVVPTPETVPLSVPDVLNPRYSYGGGKIACELLALHCGGSELERVVVFRPHNVYGPDMGWEHVLPQFVVRTVETLPLHPQGPLPFPIQGDGAQTRSFVHIDDFTDAFMLLAERGAHLGIYHVGNPEEITIAEVAAKVVRHFGREIALQPGPPAPGGTARRCPDIVKLAALGFRPKISFDAGLPSLADWYAHHHAERRQSAPALTAA
jgi:dTDP-glucose 4,6-dehydratase/UDP-glucose 4-epimerase